MECDQARQLFDAFLEGELSAPLATELGAHRVRCAECRRDLALLEVSGHIIATDEDPTQLDADFTDRLLACVGQPIGRWNRLMRRTVYIGAPMAAAAVVALAFLGVFDRNHESIVLHKMEEAPAVMMLYNETDGTSSAESDLANDRATESQDKPDQRWDELIKKAQRNIDATRQSGESLQHMLDMTVVQWLDIIEQAKRSSQQDAASTESNAPAANPKTTAKDAPEIEDL